MTPFIDLPRGRIENEFSPQMQQRFDKNPRQHKRLWFKQFENPLWRITLTAYTTGYVFKRERVMCEYVPVWTVWPTRDYQVIDRYYSDDEISINPHTWQVQYIDAGKQSVDFRSIRKPIVFWAIEQGFDNNGMWQERYRAETYAEVKAAVETRYSRFRTDWVAETDGNEYWRWSKTRYYFIPLTDGKKELDSKRKTSYAFRLVQKFG